MRVRGKFLAANGPRKSDQERTRSETFLKSESLNKDVLSAFAFLDNVFVYIFRENRLYKGEDTKHYKFGSVKAYFKKGKRPYFGLARVEVLSYMFF